MPAIQCGSTSKTSASGRSSRLRQSLEGLLASWPVSSNKVEVIREADSAATLCGTAHNLREHRPSLRLGNLMAQITSSLDPFVQNCQCVGQSLFIITAVAITVPTLDFGGRVGCQSGKWYYRYKQAVENGYQFERYWRRECNLYCDFLCC